MTDRVVAYIQDNYPDERAPVEVITQLTDSVIEVFDGAFGAERKAWPYQLVTGISADEQDEEQRTDYTFSTTAMIAYSLGLADGTIEGSPLAPSVTKYRTADQEKEADRRTAIDGLVSDAMLELRNQSEALVERSARSDAAKRRLGDPRWEPPLTYSLTFGWDDPFTLTWLIEVLAVQSEETQSDFLEMLIGRAEQLIESVLRTPYQWDRSDHDTAPQPVRVLQVSKKEDVEHVFPLLRILQLRKTVRRIRGEEGEKGPGDLAGAREYLADRVHRQLSESQIRDGNFDPAELVLALEGWLSASGEEINTVVVDRVFAVLEERLAHNPYWRPLKPFKATAQGLILLPQSVEIANSLLRICALPGLRRYEYFARNKELLSSYTRWVLTRTFRGSFTGRHGQQALVGWESEFTHRHDRIHLWHTSQVLIYLQHYAAMLREHIAQTMLNLAGLKATPISGDASPGKEWKNFVDGDPLKDVVGDDSRYLVYHQIDVDFVRPRLENRLSEASYSLLLYGPPGTGKSTIAEELCRRLGFRFLRLTPSDFITSGGEAVEARTKAIFTVLEEQTDLVVLFDEIDNLLLDRNSKLYREQGDIFRLLTPGMLTKLNDLAKRRSVVFVIATNYYERIDAAIKRPGRVDARHLVLPPGAAQRKRYLKEPKQLGERFSTLPDGGKELLAKSARFTYAELAQLIEQVSRRHPEATGASLDTQLKKAIHDAPPMAHAGNYAARLERDGTHGGTVAGATEEPWEEYALLAFLDLDATDALSENVRKALEGAPLESDVKDDDVHDRLRDKIPRPGEPE